jgi:predicted DNA-binding protein
MAENKEKKVESVRINLWMPKQMFVFLEDVSSRDGRTMSDIVREAMRDYIIKDKRIMSSMNSNEVNSGSEA